PHRPTLFPYTTLFRSIPPVLHVAGMVVAHDEVGRAYAIDFNEDALRVGRPFGLVLEQPVIRGIKLVSLFHYRLCCLYGNMEMRLDRKSTRLNSSHVKI